MLRTTIAIAALLALPASAQSPLDALQSQTANAGLYANRIPDRTFSRAFTEVCITGGGVLFDQNEAGESTQGGACRPLMKGWVIERDQREAATWTEARVACTIDDMRLPEAMEWQYSCFNADTFGLLNMIGEWEWAGNTTIGYEPNPTRGIGANMFGSGACEDGTRGFVGREDEFARVEQFRCVR
ncbi:MAG: hypothetical protein AAF184_09795 [Pseudomonadota bacterium]